MPFVVSEVSVVMTSPREAAFDCIVPVDLPSVFLGYGPLPAVVGTDEQTGAWNGVGESRRILLSDGSQVRETLTAFDRPQSFQYVVEEFSGALRHLTTRARGQWTLEAVGENQTLVCWRYAFEPRSALAWPLLWLLNRCLWRGYMWKVIEAIRAQLATRAETATER